MYIYWKIFNYRKKKLRKHKINKDYGHLTNENIFLKIYKNKVWNKKSNLDFDSGPGSHDLYLVEPYVRALIDFFIKNKDLTIVDIGCGDFNVGKQIFKYSRNYIAIDIVQDLIDRNKKKFKADNLIFKKIDVIRQNIPEGECIIIKEVFQHITNKEINSILKKIQNFKYIFITESEPLFKFKANIDKQRGPDCRIDLKSGIIIDKSPFNFRYLEKREILKIKKEDRYITTLLYIK